ncbi:glycosyltransferase, exosortase A system-associated [Sphingomonas sp. SUN019]|uniref:TIGR04063 family PEP-CTERM/XrtA system glycosyltransferase n=1 Tax=Sphingomonas sp. SUN019 TaxID=2937788 RepID=UPI0021645880|nr:TIGR04063 family PEP-CTERM/XrtA system glycosyltransferase [Sphingomonas sp. SUN019]UVO51908.1 glycosyltransferase, exosortase A system-associated [Sphingomonas sp. SUN019]
MRILHILDHGLPLQSGYTFRTRAILKAQMARGWEVAAVTGARQGTAQESETIDGIDFHRTVPPRALPSPLRELAEIAVFARRIAEVVREFRPDVLHAHSPVLDALAALKVARATSLPLVYEIRAFWEDAAVGNGTGREGSARYRATRALETWAVKRADAVAVICDGLRRDLIARGIGADRIVVSPNGVDMGLFGTPVPRDDALAAELGIDGEMVGFIGSFYDYEGLDDLIAAMPALIAARPNAQLLLIGGGPMGEALRAQAAASPVADRIRFVGRVPHEQVERYYSLVDVLAYPRKKMRLTDLVTPLKPLEAMAQGRLVAASDVGGHRELIRDGDTGTLFPADDPAALAASLAALLNDRGEWGARRVRARAFVEAERNWSSNISRYEPVYQRLVGVARMGESWSQSTILGA